MGERAAHMVARVVVDNAQAIPAARSTGDAMVRAIRDTEYANERAARSLRNHTRAADAARTSFFDFDASLGKLAVSFTAIDLGIRAVGAGFRMTTQFLRESVTEAANAEAVQRKLSAALAAQGRLTDENRQAVLGYSRELQRLTAFGDEEITTLQTQLIQLGRLSGESLREATRAALDLSVGLGIDLKAAACSTEPLSRYGLVIKKTGDQGRDFEQVLRQIQFRFGGQAAAQLDTYEGKVRALQNAWSDLKEEVGNEVLPIVTVLVDGMRETIRVVSDSGDAVSRWAEIVQRAFPETGLVIAPLRALRQEVRELTMSSNELVRARLFEQLNDISARMTELQRRGASLEGQNRASLELQALDREARRIMVMIGEANRRIDESAERAGRAVVTPPDGAGGDQADTARDMADAWRDAAAAMDSVFDHTEELRKAGRRMLEARIEEQAITDELDLQVHRLNSRRETETRLLLSEYERTGLVNQAKLDEIKRIGEQVAAIEELQKKRKEADAERRRQEREATQETVRLNKEAEESYKRLATTTATAVGTALAEIAAGEQKTGDVVKGVLRQVAIAAIHAAAAEAAAKSYASAAGLGPFAIPVGAAFAAAIVNVILSQKKFLAMKEGGKLLGGIPGVDSIPVLAQERELFVDRRTTARLEAFLDRVESSRSSTGGVAAHATYEVHLAAPFVPESEAEFERRLDKSLIPRLEALARSGHLERLLGRRV